MLPENLTAVVARNEIWTGDAATEPYEAGWAKEAIPHLMAGEAELKVPLLAEVGVGPNWDQAH